MAHKSGNEHQIAGSIAHDLVGDVHTVRCLGVASPGPFLHQPSLARDSQGGECRSDEEKGHRPGGDGTPWTSPGAEAAPCNSGAVGNPEPRTALSRRRSRTTRPTLNRRPVGAPDRHRVPGARASMRARHGARVCGVVESVRSDLAVVNRNHVGAGITVYPVGMHRVPADDRMERPSGWECRQHQAATKTATHGDGRPPSSAHRVSPSLADLELGAAWYPGSITASSAGSWRCASR